MKNIFNKNKQICTIISDTPYSRDQNGELVGLDPTVEEIDHLGSLFKKIYHFAPFYNIHPPKSFVKHQRSNITIIPMIPSGGNLFFNKLKHVFLFPLHILKLNPFLKHGFKNLKKFSFNLTAELFTVIIAFFGKCSRIHL